MPDPGDPNEYVYVSIYLDLPFTSCDYRGQAVTKGSICAICIDIHTDLFI